MAPPRVPFPASPIAIVTCSPVTLSSCITIGVSAAPEHESNSYAFRARTALPVRARARAARDDRTGDRGAGCGAFLLESRGSCRPRPLLGHATRLVLHLSDATAGARTAPRTLATQGSGRTVARRARDRLRVRVGGALRRPARDLEPILPGQLQPAALCLASA